jgi:hypothetical protein
MRVDTPFLCPCVAVAVARRRQRVSTRRLVFDDLSPSYIRTDDSCIAHDFRAPFVINEAFDAQYPPPAIRSDTHVPVALNR